MKAIHPSITPERIADLADRTFNTLDNPGVCIACGAEADDVEPDAAEGHCDNCGKSTVYGVEQITLMTF